MQTNKRTRVTHIITGLGMGGAERMLSNVVLSMDPNRFENTVISLKDLGYWGSILQERGITVYTLNMNPSITSLSKILTLYKILRDSQPDCIQGWMYHANIVATLASIGVKQRKVFWNIRCSLMDLSHYRFTTRLIFKLGAILARIPHAIVNNSRTSMRQHQGCGYKNKNLIFIPNGFDIEKFKPNSTIYKEFRIQHQLPSDAIIIGTAARFDASKDHESFLKAAAILAKQNPKVYFACAGTGMHHKNSTIHNLIVANCLEKRVLLLDQVNDIQNLLPAFDYLALTSIFGEGFPNVVAEAMLCGVECFVTDVGEALEIVGEFGFKIPKHDPVNLAKVWSEVLGRDQMLIQQNKVAVRQRIMANYALDKITNMYSEMYLDAACHTG